VRRLFNGLLDQTSRNLVWIWRVVNRALGLGPSGLEYVLWACTIAGCAALIWQLWTAS
jgi:hypothetical protein